MILQHKFVDLLTEDIEDGIIYISMRYNTAIHKCACGCGNEVVTPISPNDWKLFYDGKSITLTPSIGNWNFECRSHYWIRNSQVCYVENWSQSKIKKERNIQRKATLLNHKKNKVHSQNLFWLWLCNLCKFKKVL